MENGGSKSGYDGRHPRVRALQMASAAAHRDAAVHHPVPDADGPAHGGLFFRRGDVPTLPRGQESSLGDDGGNGGGRGSEEGSGGGEE